MRPFFLPLGSLVFLLTAVAGMAQAQAPVINAGGVVNAASSQSATAVGGLISIYGSNLSSATLPASAIPLPTSLNGVSVTFNGSTCPLLVVSSGQINAQIPWEAVPAAPPTSNTVKVTVGGQTASATANLGLAAPAVFTYAYGSGQAVAYNYTDGTIASVGPIANFPTVPYRATTSKDVLVILATGLGAVSPPVVSGASPTSVSSTEATPIVVVGGVIAQVLFSGLSQYPGVYQLNVMLGPGTPTGTVPLQILLGGYTSRNDVTIGVSN